MDDLNRMFQATCDGCHVRTDLVPTAGRIVIYTHGVMVLEFFCPACRAFNRYPMTDLVLVKALRRAGVPTSVVRTPAEMTEHPPLGAPVITAQELEAMEVCNAVVFEQFLISELMAGSS